MIKAVILFPFMFIGLPALAYSHEGGNFGRVECSQNLEYTQNLSEDSELYSLTLRQIGSSRNYILNIFSMKYGGGEKKHRFNEVVRVTAEDVLAFFKGRRAMVRIYLDELDQSSLSFDGLRILLICETNMEEHE